MGKGRKHAGMLFRHHGPVSICNKHHPNYKSKIHQATSALKTRSTPQCQTVIAL